MRTFYHTLSVSITGELDLPPGRCPNQIAHAFPYEAFVLLGFKHRGVVGAKPLDVRRKSIQKTLKARDKPEPYGSLSLP